MITENYATGMGSSMKKNIKPADPNHFRHTKTNGMWWATKAVAGFVLFGVGKVVIDAFLDFFIKPVVDYRKPGKPVSGGPRGRSNRG